MIYIFDVLVKIGEIWEGKAFPSLQPSPPPNVTLEERSDDKVQGKSSASPSSGGHPRNTPDF